jgi:tetratricopeptide (TPR) repeat protein
MKDRTIFAALAKTVWRVVLVALLPFLLCHCLTTKSKTKAPQFRGLNPTEASRLAGLNDPSFKATKSSMQDKDIPLEQLAGQADLFLQNREYESSLMNYAKVLAADPQRHDIRYKMGVILLLLGQLPEAKKELAEVLAHQADNYQAHEALGLVFLQENNLAGAQQEFQNVLAVDPNRFYSRYLLGVAHLQGNQLTQALADFKQAHALDPKNARVMADLGWTSYKLKNYEEASRWLNKAAELRPDDKKINLSLGMTLAALKKYPEALKAFSRSGDAAQGYNNIGVHYFAEGHYAEAARCFQKALELRKTFYQEASINLEKALKRLQEQSPEASNL